MIVDSSIAQDNTASAATSNVNGGNVRVKV